MSAASAAVEALIDEAVDAINRRDGRMLAELLGPDGEVATGRRTHRGTAELIAWGEHGYDHLDRHYELDELRAGEGRVVALARVQYRWRESGLVGDESPIAIVFELIDGRLRRIRFADDPAAVGAYDR